MLGRRWINKKMWVDEYKKELLSDREVLVNMNSIKNYLSSEEGHELLVRMRAFGAELRKIMNEEERKEEINTDKEISDSITE